MVGLAMRNLCASLRFLLRLETILESPMTKSTRGRTDNRVASCDFVRLRPGGKANMGLFGHHSWDSEQRFPRDSLEEDRRPCQRR